MVHFNSFNNMTFVVGYRGPQSMDQHFTDNPLRAAVSPNIVLSSDEIAAVLDGTNWGDWFQLNPQRKSQVARQALLNRGDRESAQQAEQLGLNVAVYSNIQVIQSPVSDGMPSFLSNFLL